MTSFATAGPIAASVRIVAGDIRVVAADGDSAVVEVSPTDPTNDRDCRDAQATTVTCSDGHLRVLGPNAGALSFTKKYGSVQVSLGLPRGSELDVVTSLGAITVEGELGRCRVRTSAGDIAVQDAASADLRTGFGAVAARAIAGEAYCSTGSGAVQIDRIGGPAEVRNSNGHTRIGEAGGRLRVKAANGSVAVDRARADVVATSANGDLRIGSAESGGLQLKTAVGRIEIGIPTGTAALLDVSSKFGTVHNGLDATDQPGAGEPAVEVHAQTSAGDIDILRVTASGS